jgi:hypothetical protein
MKAYVYNFFCDGSYHVDIENISNVHFYSVPYLEINGINYHYDHFILVDIPFYSFYPLSEQQIYKLYKIICQEIF